MKNTADQGWDQLHARIDQMFGKYLRPELHKAEYKTLKEVDYMSQVSADDKKKYPKVK